jgi:hypothetical protein
MRTSWRTGLLLLLILLSAVFYGINYGIYRDTTYMGRLLTMQLGFVPVQVILITLFLNSVIAGREKRARLAKLNMVIGSFFSEFGEHLLRIFTDLDPKGDDLKRGVLLAREWTDTDFAAAHDYVNKHDYAIRINVGRLLELREFLLMKRTFMLWLVENPNLLEHESFTDLLMSVFHLTEELAHRGDFSTLPDTDYRHLAEDIKRAYRSLLSEWLEYMKHIRTSYPYFYSLAVRANPLNPASRPEVT